MQSIDRKQQVALAIDVIENLEVLQACRLDADDINGWLELCRAAQCVKDVYRLEDLEELDGEAS